MANLWEMMFGRKDKAKRFQQFTPEQMQALQQVSQGLTSGEGPYGDIYGQFNPEQYGDMFNRGVREPAMRQWEQQIMPSIMQGHADQGNSSAMNNALAFAGSNLTNDLGAQESNFMNQWMMQNQQNRMQGVNQLQGMQPYQTYVQGGGEGLVNSVLNNFASSAGKGFNPMSWMGGGGNQQQNQYRPRGYGQNSGMPAGSPY